MLEAPDGFGDAGFHYPSCDPADPVVRGQPVADERRARRSRPSGIAVATDTPHKFAADGLLAFIFVEPESRAGRALTERWLRGRPMAAIEDAAFAHAAEPLRQAFDAPLTPEAMLAIARSAVAVLAGETAPALPDARVRRVIDHALAHPELSLDRAAAGAGVYLSPSRLRHLFVEQTGLAFKTYMLWQRLVRALEAYAVGASLTEAAHLAGFSDSAHFSRVFKRTFGLPATTLTRL